MLKFIPPEFDFNQIKILKKCNLANKKLAELKGICGSIPNSEIFINTLALSEAKDSSQIENIITTYNDICKQEIEINVSPAAKEVKSYVDALKHGYSLVETNNMLIVRHLIEINNVLQNNNAGIRNQIGTVLRNANTGEIVYEPPQNVDEINILLKNLEEYINDDTTCDLDPLIKMAIIHHRFESIHPFFDGNGRTGRILNILYIILKDLLDIPVLYLSKYIIKHKSTYYELLQTVRDDNRWDDWVIYMLDAVENVADDTINQIHKIQNLMTTAGNLIKLKLPKLYSDKLIDGLFLHVYTTIDYLQQHLGVTRQTASSYLNSLTEIGVLEKVKLGKSYYFVNKELFQQIIL
jgi:Fic family protein